ncbi:MULTISPECIES: sugar ABC transporter substrate-binding protein [Micrococcaceae]|uniref:sugar ABC transporter substrate-binding protein n=1 Tax=Micrococcaceae TaxID=1268 RepID=UPI0012FBA9A4|nr:sugar ABC transporter substrate-binding protein [Pseudarthrobacter sp. GA104]MUU72531.1 extracellular solute-binding protein [Pseudarthrobacter sp. GA104]HEU4667299.1 sugar ABC transporter substrate-binding protein [Arthrobacter sp.]
MIHANAKKAAAVGIAAALLLTACGRDSAGPAATSPAKAVASGPATGTLTVWAQGAEGEALPALLKDFESENPDVKVNVTAIPWDAALSKYQTAIAGGTTPDVAQMGTTWMGDFSTAFDPTPAEIDTSSFFPGSLKSTEVEGTKYGVPWYVDTRVVYYRSDLAEKAGITKAPATWEDFRALAEALQTKAGAKFGVQLPTGGADSYQATLPFQWSNGAKLMNDDGTKWTLDTPESAEALKYYAGFFKDGIASKAVSTGTTAEASFVDGSAPMMISGPWHVGLLNKTGGEGFADKYKVAPMPKAKTATSFVGGSNMVVFKKSENRDSAWKLLQWLSKPEVQLKWYKATGDLPSQQTAWKDPTLADDSKLSVFGEQLKTTDNPPAVQTWTQVSAAADSEIEQIVKAGKDPADALKSLQQTADSIGTGK